LQLHTIDDALVIGMREMTANQSPKQTRESVAALRESFCGGAAWLKRYVYKQGSNKGSSGDSEI